MGLSLVTPPAFDPISLAEAKAHCRITSTDEDGLIAGYILSARQFVENSTQLRLATQTLDYTIDDGWPCEPRYSRRRIYFPIAPVQSITSISYVDTSGATQVLSVSDYRGVNVGDDVQSGSPYVEEAYGVTWPSVRCQGAAITVRFVAGWSLSKIPNPLMQAMRILISHEDQNREAVGASGIAEIPLGVEGFISPYRMARVA